MWKFVRPLLMYLTAYMRKSDLVLTGKKQNPINYQPVKHVRTVWLLRLFSYGCKTNVILG